MVNRKVLVAVALLLGGLIVTSPTTQTSKQPINVGKSQVLKSAENAEEAAAKAEAFANRANAAAKKAEESVEKATSRATGGGRTGRGTTTGGQATGGGTVPGTGGSIPDTADNFSLKDAEAYAAASEEKDSKDVEGKLDDMENTTGGSGDVVYEDGNPADDVPIGDQSDSTAVGGNDVGGF